MEHTRHNSPACQYGIPKELEFIIKAMKVDPEISSTMATYEGILEQYRKASLDTNGPCTTIMYWDGERIKHAVVEGLNRTREPSIQVQLLLEYLKASFPNKKFVFKYEHEFKEGDATIKMKEYKIDGYQIEKVRNLINSWSSYIAINSISVDLVYHKLEPSTFMISNKPLEVIKPVITVRMAQL